MCKLRMNASWFNSSKKKDLSCLGGSQLSMSQKCDTTRKKQIEFSAL